MASRVSAPVGPSWGRAHAEGTQDFRVGGSTGDTLPILDPKDLPEPHTAHDLISRWTGGARGS